MNFSILILQLIEKFLNIKLTFINDRVNMIDLHKYFNYLSII